MQKDYMAMMNQQPTAPGPQGVPSVAQAQGAVSPEDIKQNILEFMQDLNIIPAEGAERQQIDQMATELAELMAQGDEAAMIKHPLYKILVEAAGTLQQELEKNPEAQQVMKGQQQTPTDFAGMMPGGGANAG